MCGIAGYIGKKSLGNFKCDAALSLMLQRGPDAQDYTNIESGDLHISLLHSRLSIVDLDSRANQPMTIGAATIVLNGEIYNYKELRENLIKQNISLRTQSDTEVLLHYYLLYGERCVDHFEGMWAFAIFDRALNRLFLCRDRFAEKPLWFFQDASGFYFASESRILKALCDKTFEVNENHVLRYLVNGHKSLNKTHETFYKNLEQVPFATHFMIGEDLNPKKTKYWNPTFEPKQLSEQEAIEQTRALLINSMKLRLRADVPMAFCLSGGIDSAGLVSIASKEFNYDVTAFSIIDEDPRYDESELIQATVNDLGCKSVQIKLSAGEHNLDRLKKLIQYHDAPISTISYFVHSFLSEAIHAKGFRIALSGTGSDEIFTGYYDHFILHLFEMRNDPSFPELLNDWKNHVSNFVRHPSLKNSDYYFKDPNIRSHIYLNREEFKSYLKKDFKEDFFETNYSNNLLRNRMLNELFNEVVPVILQEDDLNSMMYSIENRSPFLDKSLMEFAYTIENKHMIKGGYAKHVLRSALKGILNDPVRLAREKKGFNADIKSILDFKDPNQRALLLDDGPIFNWIDKSKIETLLKQDFFSNSFKKFLFNFVNARIFLDQNSGVA